MKNTLLLTILFKLLFIMGLSTGIHAQAIAAGESHSLFLCANGTVQAVGGGNSGQLGDGSFLSRLTAVSVSGMTGVTGFDGGNWHTLFAKNDGTAWTTGRNNYGQLGDGTLVNKNIAAQVPGLSGITAVSGGSGFSVFLKSDGTVWSVGYNYFGELGDGTTVYKSSPVQVLGLTGIIAISAANQFTIYLKNDGTVWASGRNQFGQFGNGSISTFNPTPVQTPGLTNVTAIATGGGFSVFLKSDGTVWASGENGYGQLGDGSMYTTRTSPVQVIGLTGITKIAVGTHHALFLKNDGTVWGVGHNSAGELGDGTLVHKTTAIQIPGLSAVTEIAAGSFHSLFLKTDGTVWAVGNNSSAELGDGTVVDKSSVIQPTGLCSVGLGVVENPEAAVVSVYPNPCNELLYIETEHYENTSVALFNLQGQLLQSLPLQTFRTSLPTSTLASGVYIVQIKSPEGTTIKRIVKN